MADTTTTLNPGVGGDVMDESLVTNSSGTSAKRPRVVLGNELGQVVDPQIDQATLGLMLIEMQRQTELLRAILANTTSISLSTDELDSMRSG